MGVLAGYEWPANLEGDVSLSRRPMQRVIDPLRKMGCCIEPSNKKFLPLKIQGRAPLLPIQYELPVASAQVKSCLLLAGLFSAGETTVIEPEATRDHTERMLKAMGADLRIHEIHGKKALTITGKKALKAIDITVPSDISSAAFPIVAALITPGSEVTLTNVGINPTRTGILKTLDEMGANITLINLKDIGGEPVADIKVKYSSLKGVRVPAARAPSMIDEYPVLSIAAAVAEGETTFEGVGELRVKESDRLAAIEEGLRLMGVNLSSKQDQLTIKGTGGNNLFGDVTIESHHDHRIAMSFLVAGLVAGAPVKVTNAEMIMTSFPTFFGMMQGLGADIRQ